MVLGLCFIGLGAAVFVLAIVNYPLPPFEPKDTLFQKLKKLMEKNKRGMALEFYGLVTIVTGLVLIIWPYLQPIL